MDLLTTLAAYVLGVLAVVLTFGFIAAVFIIRHAWKHYRLGQENFAKMEARMNESRRRFYKDLQ